MAESNVHKGHRERLKRKANNFGEDTLELHEALELLLYYGIARKNTNLIAHDLLKKFGSLSGVFEADINDLCTIDGINYHTATLIHLIPILLRMYMIDKYEIRNQIITPQNIGDYIVPLFYGHTTEKLYAIFLDADFAVIGRQKISDGTRDYSNMDLRKIVKLTLETNATNVILVHNHPNGLLIPSKEDLDVTRIIDKALALIRVRLLDHFVVANNEFLSIFDKMKKLGYKDYSNK